MKNYAFAFFAAIVLILALPLWAAPPAKGPVLTFDGSTVVVSGVTAKGSVLLCGALNIPRGYYIELSPVSVVLTDDDGDGVVRYDTQASVAWRSVWAATDLATGDYTTAWPSRSPAKQVQFRGRGLVHAANGKLNQVEHAGDMLNVVVARPHGNGWAGEFVDGAGNDADGKPDGKVNMGVGNLKSVGTGAGAAPPDELLPDDVVFVIDAAHLQIVATKVTK